MTDQNYVTFSTKPYLVLKHWKILELTFVDPFCSGQFRRRVCRRRHFVILTIFFSSNGIRTPDFLKNRAMIWRNFNFTFAPLPPETRVALGVLQGQSRYPCYWYSNPRLLEKYDFLFFFFWTKFFLKNLIKSRNPRDNWFNTQKTEMGRAVGQPDFYWLLLSFFSIKKLRSIQHWVRKTGRTGTQLLLLSWAERYWAQLALLSRGLVAESALLCTDIKCWLLLLSAYKQCGCTSTVKVLECRLVYKCLQILAVVTFPCDLSHVLNCATWTYLTVETIKWNPTC